MNLLTVEQQLIEKMNDMNRIHEQYKRDMSRIENEIEELRRVKSILMSGLDLEKVKQAVAIINIEGLKTGKYNGRCVTEAIKDIADGTDKMAKEYFGVKDYAHWSDQSSDHPYGYGPTHGSITFSVGYKRDFRGGILNDEQRECCLYYLNVLGNKVHREAIANLKVAR